MFSSTSFRSLTNSFWYSLHRSFHLQGDDKESLNDWLTHFMRDRYFAVCEERNAYQQMQSEMTAVLDTIASQTKCVEIDKDIVEKQLEDAILAKEEAVAMLRSMLVIMGVSTVLCVYVCVFFGPFAHRLEFAVGLKVSREATVRITKVVLLLFVY